MPAPLGTIAGLAGERGRPFDPSEMSGGRKSGHLAGFDRRSPVSMTRASETLEDVLPAGPAMANKRGCVLLLGSNNSKSLRLCENPCARASTRHSYK